MFEKEAEEYIDNLTRDWTDGEYSFSVEELRQAILHFAEFGYNKANEWHYVKDGLPKTDGYYLVFNKGTRSVIIGMFVNGQFENCFPVAWKEIVLPELKRSV